MPSVVSLVFAAGLVALLAAPATAAPVSPSLPDVTELSQVQKVHGFHRRCRWGPYRGWWHRHLYNGRAVGCRRYYRSYGYYPYYGPGVTLRFGGRHHHHHHHRFHHHGRRR